ncbi:protein SET [Anabrus simplex]|uniref:protein SET n=1 Tax=Anabrus simplex TaxID=316456 RepID=UPI0035A2B556
MENPYFENELLMKEFHWSSVEGERSEGSQIQWKEGYEQLRRIKKTVNETLGRERNSFLDWFNDHKDPVNDNIALGLKELWTFPKLFYTLHKKMPKHRKYKASRYPPQSLRQDPKNSQDRDRDGSSTGNDSIANISETRSTGSESVIFVEDGDLT